MTKIIDESNDKEEEEDPIQEDEGLILQRYKDVVFSPANPDIKTLYDNYNGGDLILHPEYQRNFVWNKQKASNLIESVLLNIPIPIIYTSDDGDKEEVVDGQQRLKSIFSFIEGRFPNPDGTFSPFKLSKLQLLPQLSGKKFSELDDMQRRKIMRRPLSFIRIKSNSEEDDVETIKFEMFERLNTNITKLNAQELRNCIYRGIYNDFLKQLATNSDYQEILNSPTYQKRMLDVELILLFFTFYHRDYKLYKGNMKQLINLELNHHRNLDPTDKNEMEKQFKKSISLIKTIFGKNAFRCFSYDKKLERYYFETKFNQGLFLILMCGFTPYEKPQIMDYCDLIREELLNLEVHEEEFYNALTGSGTNSKEKVFKKFKIWEDTLHGILGYPKTEPRAFSYKLKATLFPENNKPTCVLCGQQIQSIDDSEVDHIKCYWRGGQTIPANARLTHRYCNRKRGGDAK